MSKRVTAVNFCLSITLRISSVVYNKDVSVECSSLLSLQVAARLEKKYDAAYCT